MATIDELMKGKATGSVKVANDFCRPDFWFQPYYKNEFGFWVGICSLSLQGVKAEETVLSVCEKEDHWKLYSSPEETVELFEWIYRVETALNGARWFVYSQLMTEDQARKELPDNKHIKTGRSFKVPK